MADTMSAAAPVERPPAVLSPLRMPDSAAHAADLAALAARAATYATQARGPGTRRAYRAAWRQFCEWCAGIGREPLAGDPDTIAMYLVRRADDGRAVSTLRVGLAAIRAAHHLAGIPLDLRQPVLTMVLEGINRSRGRRPKRQATPAVPDLLRPLLATRPGADTPLGARDRAMLLLGFAGALRRAELVALTLADVTAVPGRGFLLTIGRSKTDPQGRGEPVAIAANPADPGFCPETVLHAWLAHRHQAADQDAACLAADRTARPPWRSAICGRPHGGVIFCLPDGRWFDPAQKTWRDAKGRLRAGPTCWRTARRRTTRVVLAAAHLDHKPANSRRRNLRSLCQRCHLLHDWPQHRRQRWITCRRRYALGDLFLGGYAELSRIIAMAPTGVTAGSGS